MVTIVDVCRPDIGILLSLVLHVLHIMMELLAHGGVPLLVDGGKRFDDISIVEGGMLVVVVVVVIAVGLALQGSRYWHEQRKQ